MVKMILLNDYCNKEYGKRIIKLAIDGGFTCPNRDGSKGYGGCSFCSELGSGDFAGKRCSPIKNQLLEQKEILSKKWKDDAIYVAYFQSFTSTYADLEYLKKVYDEAVSSGLVEGLVIATRPDCINQEICDLLAGYHVFWVELGLQSAFDSVLSRENIAYSYDDHINALRMLKRYDIKTVSHFIIGLENDDFIAGLRKFINEDIHPWGIKFAMLNILQNTALEKRWNSASWNLPSMEEYISLIKKAFEIIPENMVVHRYTGDGDHKNLIAPLWVKNKRAVLGGVMKKPSGKIK